MKGQAIIGLAIAAAALSSCAGKVDGEPVYSLDQCRHVTLIDSATEKEIVGAEDLAFDAAERRVLISAYDRRAAEESARAGAAVIAEGGVYAVSLDALKAYAASLDAAPLIPRSAVAGGLRPHGINFDASRREITFVNRAYRRENGRWKRIARIERASAGGAIVVSDANEPRCSANDVATVGNETFISFDHAACGWRAGVEEIFGGKDSGVDKFNGERAYKGARHANGIAALADGRLALAATRDKAVLILEKKDGAFAAAEKIRTPGAPDNLNVNMAGDVIAALYPSLGAIGAQRKLGIGRSASRVVSLDIESGAVRLLFDDPKAHILSAASSALEEEGMLIIGSALDAGIAVCSEGAAP